MKRVPPLFLLPIAVTALPVLAHAEASISGTAGGGVEHSSNVYSAPDGVKGTPDEILFVTPSLEAALVTRGVDLSATYSLGYYHYQAEQDLSRALHTLFAKAALVWWDDLDLEINGRLDPRVVSYASPIDDPTNQVQQAAAGGRLMLRREFGASTRGSAGYVGEQVTWLETHEDDEDRVPPGYLAHGPELAVERDVGPRLVVGADYRYKIQDYDESADKVPPTGDYTSHTVTGRFGLDATDWLSLSMAYGFSQVAYAKGDPDDRSATRGLADVRLTAGGDVARLAMSARQNATQDIFGNPAETRAAKMGVDYTPYAPWGLGVGATYGEIDYDDSAAQATGGSQAFVLGEASVFYRVAVGEISLGASHHESLRERSDEKIVVNRASFRLGGRF